MPEANISPPTDDETTARAAGEFGEAGDSADLDNATDVGDAAHVDEDTADVGDAEDVHEDVRTGLTPRQARRIRIVVSGVVMVAVAVALVVRLRSAPSVLTVGFYGIALILSGVAIGLSRRGRTRVATGVLALGFAAVGLAEWLLASVE